MLCMVMIQTAPGAGMFPHFFDKSLKGMLELSGRMLSPTYSGDTIYPMLEITGLKDQKTTGVVTLSATIHNERGEKVLEEPQKLLLRKKSQK